MPVSVDTFGQITTTTSGSPTQSTNITLGTSPGALYVCAWISGLGSNSINSVSFNSVALTNVYNSGVGGNVFSIWALANPSSGTHALAISGSGSSLEAGFSYESFFGTPATTARLFANTKLGYSSGATITLTTTGTGSWLMVFGEDISNLGPWTGGTGATLRTDGSSRNAAVFDSNAVVSVGSNTVTVNAPSGSGGGSVYMIEVPNGVRSFSVADSIASTDTKTFKRGAVFSILDAITSTDHLGVFARAFFFTILNSMSLIDSVVSLAYKWQRQVKDISSFTNAPKDASSWTDQSKDSTTFINQTKN